MKRMTSRSWARPVASVLGLLLAVSPCPAAPPQVVEYPGTPPGVAEARISRDDLVLENAVIRCLWSFKDGVLRPVSVTDKEAGRTIERDGGEVFEIAVPGNGRLAASAFTLVGQPQLRNLAPRADSPRLAERFAGKQLSAVLCNSDGNLEVSWRAELRDEGNAVRQAFTLRAKGEDVPLGQVSLIDLSVPQADVIGLVPGSPVVSGNLFFALEHPKSVSSVLELEVFHETAEGPARDGDEDKRIRCSLVRDVPLEPGKPVTETSVIGVVPAGQLRRGFLYYVERERAHPYRPFLHYNSWYDVAWADRFMSEGECVAAIELFGRELTEERGVRLASFVFDDGWDDPKSLWKIDKTNFPRGFAPLLDAAKRYRSTLGTWLSPWGGYGEKRKQRLKYGREQGFEINATGFSMAGEKYFARFLETSLQMIEKNGVNFFKYDGMSAGDINETDAVIQLTRELRGAAPDLFISETTGTWPSAYWLWLGDSTWRGGRDMGWHGKGSKRQQWITYRDMDTYHGVVVKGPLYPLNSLMTQGVCHAQRGYPAELSDDADEMRKEFRSFFASGTCLQELYITPQRMTEENWDDLAEAASWSHANADVLVDVHWIGGDPGKGEPYGWASWSRRKGILALRNPSDRRASISIDVGKAFELPPGAARQYTLRSPWKNEADRPAVTLRAAEEHEFELDPFEVLVFDAVAQ